MLQIRFRTVENWLRSGDHRQAIFLIGFLLSTLGSSLTNIALAYQYLLHPNGMEYYAILMYGATITGVFGASYFGNQADRLTKYHQALLISNLSSAATSLSLAFSPPFWLVVVLVIASTALSLWTAIIVRKLLPQFFTGVVLHHVTARLTEIAAIGAVVGPILGPLFPTLGIDLSTMFAIDALMFIATALIYKKCFKLTNTSAQIVPHSPYRGLFDSMYDSLHLIRNRSLRPLMIAYFPFSLGVSSLFFTLALFNKHISNGDEFSFSVPILAMFCGRTLASKFTRSRYYSFNYCEFLATGTSVAFLSMLLIPLSTTLTFFSFIQFILGAGFAMAVFAHTMWLQTECDKDNLGLAVGTLRTIDAGTKLIGIPLITLLASNDLLWATAITIGSCFGLSTLFILKWLNEIKRSSMSIEVKNYD